MKIIVERETHKKTEKENIKSNLIKNAYPLFLFNKVIKKYLDYKFSSNWNQLKDKSDFIALDYHILAIFHNISKINFPNFAKSFVTKILTFS